jgi:hypothetical protein
MAADYSTAEPERFASTDSVFVADPAPVGTLAGLSGISGGEQRYKNAEGEGQVLEAGSRGSGPSYEKKEDLFIFCLSGNQKTATKCGKK